MARPREVGSLLKPVRVVAAIAEILQLFSFLFAVPLLVALAYEPWDTTMAGISLPRNAYVFLASFLMAAAVWLPIDILTRSTKLDELQDREAYLVVGIGWLVLCVVAMLPFLISGLLRSPADAFFEAMSGLTTTGATVIRLSLDHADESLMVWRALLQYVGGMGIIVLSIAVLARLTHGGMQLLQAEAPGPEVTRIRPRLAQTAKSLWLVYAAYTGLLFVILLALMRNHGLSWSESFYDALVHTFTTMATGGFSNHDASIGHYNSLAIELVIMVFMLGSGINYALHYRLVKGDRKPMLRDPEVRFYAASFVVASLAITLLLSLRGDAVLPSLRAAAFTVASLLTSSGFGTADFDLWPAATHIVLLVIMVTGATSGSTSGGLKHVRILLLLKLVKRQILRIGHPKAVIPIRLGSARMKDSTLFAVAALFFTFVALWAAGTLILTVTDPVLGLVDSASAALSALGNMGPGLGEVGPSRGYWNLLPSSKILLSFLMWAGRLEVFTVLILFMPRSWKH